MSRDPAFTTIRPHVLAGLAVLALTDAAPGWPAAEQPDPDVILRRAYDNYRAHSSEATVRMTIHRPSWERHLEMHTWTRGDEDALVRFVEPAQDAGNATLKVGEDIWVFNPRLNQVIKLPPSMMAQSWMGSDFSYDDLAKSEDVLTRCTHQLVATESVDEHISWRIDALPKPDEPIVWGKVTLRVRDDDVILEEGFYDQDMKLVRHMTTDAIGRLGGRQYPLVMSMHPAEGGDQWTRIETSSARFDVAVPDYVFTLSNLQNPRPSR